MNKTAALARKLLDLASENPRVAKLASQKVSALLKQGHPVPVTHESAYKTAGPETAAFAAWAVARDKKYTENECRAVLDRLKIPMIEAEAAAPRRSGPLAIGETVSPDQYTNTNEANVDACKKYHKEYGEVEHVDATGVAVRFDDNRLVRFEGPNKPGKALGIGRATRPSVVDQRSEGRALIEVIYISDKNAAPPSKSRIMQVQDYVDRGEIRGEERSRVYYSGLGLRQAEGQAGYYFTLFAQGRDTFPRSINPKKGTVLYLGRVGGRPGGWMAEYEAMMAKAATEEDDDDGSSKSAAASPFQTEAKKGEYTIFVTKGRATRWDYSVTNPQGGGGGSTSYTSAKAALAAATQSVPVERAWLVYMTWDASVGDYVVTKKGWYQLPPK